MYLGKFPSASVVLLIFGQRLVAASLLQSPLPALGQNVPCDDISVYTTEYFMKTYIYEPPETTCLFYTFNLTETALRFSRGGRRGLTTIWDIWPSTLYSSDVYDTKNSLRCIFDDNNKRLTYFENMSRAMALLCDTYATVMTNDPKKVPKSGIYGRIEEPTLQQIGNPDGQVDTIIAVDPKGDNIDTIWTRPGRKKREIFDHDKRKLAKRQPTLKLDPAQLHNWFGDLPW